jgi:hypothetical protein
MNTTVIQQNTERFKIIKEMLNYLDYNKRTFSKREILSYMSDKKFEELEDKYYEEMKWRSRGCEYW